MFRTVILISGLAVPGLGLFCSGAASDEPPANKRQQVRVTAKISNQFPALPGYWMLRKEDVRNQIGLSDEQVAKLEELGKKYTESMRFDWKEIQQLPNEKRREKYKEIQEQRRKKAEEITAAVEKVLTEKQREELKDIAFQMQAPGALMSPRVLEALGLSEDQKQKLTELREQMAEKYREIREQTYKESLDVLTPEQTEKLKELAARGFRVEATVKVKTEAAQQKPSDAEEK